MPDIDHVSVTFGNGIKREEYGPVKKAEVTIAAAVGEGEDGAVILAQIGTLALAKVADLLSAPKPDNSIHPTQANIAANPDVFKDDAAPPKRRVRQPKDQFDAQIVEASKDTSASATDAQTSSPVNEGSTQQTSSQQSSDGQGDDSWETTAEDRPVNDAELLASTSDKAKALGGTPEQREKIKALIGSFNPNQTPGVVFKVQDIPAAQRRDYLTKLVALS